jgi:diketogulonate reductase-like aldo/keto reductase
MKKLKLNKQAEIPILGFGTWELQGKQAVKSIKTAIEVGYRHIDTADYYQNHQEVGQAIKESKVKRGDIFLVTKLWPNELGEQDAKKATKRFLNELQTEYIDLLLIHWPSPLVPTEETLRAMEEMREEGIINAIGVSNYDKTDLKEALDTETKVTNNQIEYHPSKQPKQLTEFCKENNITVTAYSPLGRGKALNNPTIKKIANKYNKPSEQVIINWLIAQDIITIPKATSKEHIESNFKALDWQLDKEDIDIINKID